VVDVNNAAAGTFDQLNHPSGDKGGFRRAVGSRTFHRANEALDLVPQAADTSRARRRLLVQPISSASCARRGRPPHLLRRRQLRTTCRDAKRIWQPMTRRGRGKHASAPGGLHQDAIEAMGTDDDVTYPSRSTQLDYEGELAVVIGAKGRISPCAGQKPYLGITGERLERSRWDPAHQVRRPST